MLSISTQIVHHHDSSTVQTRKCKYIAPSGAPCSVKIFLKLTHLQSMLSFCSLSFFVNILTRETGSKMFVGDHRVCVTPVPIPNTAVKPNSPMILFSGKVGYRRLYSPLSLKLRGLFSFSSTDYTVTTVPTNYSSVLSVQ